MAAVGEKVEGDPNTRKMMGTIYLQSIGNASLVRIQGNYRSRVVLEQETNEQQIASLKATKSSKPRGPSYAWYTRWRATSDTRVCASERGLQTFIFTPALASVAKRIFWLGWTHF